MGYLRDIPSITIYLKLKIKDIESYNAQNPIGKLK